MIPMFSPISGGIENEMIFEEVRHVPVQTLFYKITALALFGEKKYQNQTSQFIDADGTHIKLIHYRNRSIISLPFLDKYSILKAYSNEYII